jgi:hypothetical protein
MGAGVPLTRPLNKRVGQRRESVHLCTRHLMKSTVGAAPNEVYERHKGGTHWESLFVSFFFFFLTRGFTFSSESQNRRLTRKWKGHSRDSRYF